MAGAFHAPVAQLDRVSVFETEGWRFEPVRARHSTETTELSYRPIDSPARSHGNERASKSRKGRRKSHGNSHGVCDPFSSLGYSPPRTDLLAEWSSTRSAWQRAKLSTSVNDSEANTPQGIIGERQQCPWLS